MIRYLYTVRMYFVCHFYHTEKKKNPSLPLLFLFLFFFFLLFLTSTTPLPDVPVLSLSLPAAQGRVSDLVRKRQGLSGGSSIPLLLGPGLINADSEPGTNTPLSKLSAVPLGAATAPRLRGGAAANAANAAAAAAGAASRRILCDSGKGGEGGVSIRDGVFLGGTSEEGEGSGGGGDCSSPSVVFEGDEVRGAYFFMVVGRTFESSPFFFFFTIILSMKGTCVGALYSNSTLVLYSGAVQ